MQLFYQKDSSPPSITLNADESKHLIKVLRKRIGDTIHVTNGVGELFECLIKEISQKKTVLEVKETTQSPFDNFYIHLAIAPTKNSDRMEWMLEKITEIGFHELTLIKTENSERTNLRLDRLEKKMISACKQSLKFRFPKINPITSYEDLISKDFEGNTQKLIAYVDEDHQDHLMDLGKKNGKYLILIGPEGDFSPREIKLAFDQNFKPVSLGKSRLRTETAGLSAVHILQLINRTN